MQNAQRALTPRPVRVAVPVLVSFSAEAYTIRDFTLNLSEGGIFLPTEKTCPVGTQGKLKFRVSQFDEPFTLNAGVVRIVPPGTEGQKCGIGMQFLEVVEKDLDRLRQLVEGVAKGSAVEAIRRSIRETGRTVDQELRQRPTDQKMMLAVNAQGPEIAALMRDSNPAVLIRLLDCPRLQTSHVMAMMRNPNLPTRVLSAIKQDSKWLLNEGIRYLFCTHPNAVVGEAIGQIRFLSPGRVKQLARDMKARPPVRAKALELSRGRF